MEKAHLKIPLLVGGATTSDIHTAVKIAPSYSGTVMHMRDASQNTYAISMLLNKKTQKEYEAQNRAAQAKCRSSHQQKEDKLVDLEEAKKKKLNLF